MKKQDLALNRVKQYYYEVEGSIVKALHDILTTMAKAKKLAVIIFVGRKDLGLRLTDELYDKGHKICCIVGDLENMEREQIISEFNA